MTVVECDRITTELMHDTLVSPSPLSKDKCCISCKLSQVDVSFIPIMERMLAEYDLLVSKLKRENSQLRQQRQEIFEQYMLEKQKQNEVHMSASQNFNQNEILVSKPNGINREQPVTKKSGLDIPTTGQIDRISNDLTAAKKEIENLTDVKNPTVNNHMKDLHSVKDKIAYKLGQKMIHVKKLEILLNNQARKYENDASERENYIRKLKTMLFDLSSEIKRKAKKGKKMVDSLETMLKTKGFPLTPKTKDKNRLLTQSEEFEDSNLTLQSKPKNDSKPEAYNIELRYRDFSMILNILDEFKSSLDLTLVEASASESMRKNSDLLAFLFEMKTVVTDLKVVIKDVHSKLEKEIQYQYEKFVVCERSMKAAQKAVIKHALLLEAAKGKAVSQSASFNF